jgi:hypothetical protein
LRASSWIGAGDGKQAREFTIDPRDSATPSQQTCPKRAGMAITEVDASHVVLVSQPPALTDVILEAVTDAGRVAVGA